MLGFLYLYSADYVLLKSLYYTYFAKEKNELSFELIIFI